MLKLKLIKTDPDFRSLRRGLDCLSMAPKGAVGSSGVVSIESRSKKGQRPAVVVKKGQTKVGSSLSSTSPGRSCSILTSSCHSKSFSAN